MRTDNTRLIVRSCYLGMFIQAMVINLTPLLFIPLKEELGLSFEQVGRLILINFLTQMVVDIVCGALVDRVGAKPFIVAANLLSAAGLWLFALAPARCAIPYDGLLLGTLVFSMGCGLLELLLSPIINAVPSQRKAADMALLHAFYPIGKVIVIVVTAALLYGFGARHWRAIVLAWSAIPLLNTLGFALVVLPPFAPHGRRQRLRDLVREPVYLAAVAALGLAGATEVTIAQWTSAFAEKGLGCSKIVGDLVGFCLFGVGMTAGRLWFGLKGERVDLFRVMLPGAGGSALLYVVAGLAPWPGLALAACALSGLFVSLLWPGTLSITAARFPLAGASMFALLAAAGDTGAALMPWLVGVIADAAPTFGGTLTAWFGTLTREQLGLRAGLLVATVCPLAMAALLAWLQAEHRRHQTRTAATETLLTP